MKIAIDYDSVLCNTLPLWIKQYKEIWPDRPLPQEKDFTTWNLEDAFKCTREELNVLFNAVRNNKSLKYSAPMDSNWNVWVQKMVNDGHEVKLLSANPESTRPWIKYWINKYGIDLPIDLVTIGEEKFTHEWDVLIDDSPHVLKESTKQKRGLLVVYNTPWNSKLDLKSPFQVRAYNFKDVYELVCEHNYILKELEEIRATGEEMNY